MRIRPVELVHLAGCPHVDLARRNLRAALEASGWPPLWREWNLRSPETPVRVRAFGSPTVLVDHRDVTGGTGGGSGLACRVGGAPSSTAIRRALLRPAARG